MPKFDIETHEKRIREILNQKPPEAQRPEGGTGVLQSLLKRARLKGTNQERKGVL